MRVLGTLVGLAVLVVALISVAQAATGPHGGYTATTDACAGCHRTHSAAAPKLLVNTNTALCLTCHGSGATGAETNVIDGIYEGTVEGTQNAGLNGGGFTYAIQDTSLSGTPTSGIVSSTHSVQGTEWYTTTATMWGSGALNSGTGVSFDLYCSSCHDPHGSTNYRMVKATINGVTATLTQTDELNKSYTSVKYYAGSSVWTVSDFCGACHARYDASTSASGQVSSSDSVFAFRHRTDAPSGAVVNSVAYTFTAALSLPVSTSDGNAPTVSPDNRVMVCLTCHFAHGSKATMAASSGAVPWPGGALAPNGNQRSALLRLDNRGVCENCHDK